jgi:hypothetical protein
MAEQLGRMMDKAPKLIEDCDTGEEALPDLSF